MSRERSKEKVHEFSFSEAEVEGMLVEGLVTELLNKNYADLIRLTVLEARELLVEFDGKSLRQLASERLYWSSLPDKRESLLELVQYFNEDRNASKSR